MKTKSVTIGIELANDILEVDFYGDVLLVDNGIGPYEFQGYKGYDSRKELELQDIWWDVSNYTNDQNAIITAHLKEHYETICREIEEESGLEIYDFEGANPDEVYESRRDR